MTLWSPEWQIFVNGTNRSSLTLVGLTINAGRIDFNSQPQASYANFELINTNNQDLALEIADAITIKIKKTNGSYVSIFGGRISDLVSSIRSVGSTTYVTAYRITALGAISKLQKAVWTSSLAQNKDGDQIYAILSDLYLNNWNEVPATETWAAYDVTTTWANAENVGLGEIDRPGQYTMEQRSASAIDYYSLITDTANSALGYIYEDSNGNIAYADAAHRQTYLIANGYSIFSANDALALNLRTSAHQGNLINKYVINYGNNYGNQVTSQNTTSQSDYGIYGQTTNSRLHDNTDAQAVADRTIQLRAYPRAQIEGISFALQSPELDNTDRDALLTIFMGLPIRLTDLPVVLSSNGQFEGFVEGWTFRASVSGLFLDLTVSPTEFSAVAQNWDQVNSVEKWNTLNTSLQWEDAIGVIS